MLYLYLCCLYPLDSYAQVKEAARYFGDTHAFMDPDVRHEYCQNLVKRAEALAIPVTPLIQKYGSSTYAPGYEVEICLDARRTSLLDGSQRGILDKLAERRNLMKPEEFAVALQEFDKMASLDQHYGDIPDAYYTTFGKTAKERSAGSEAVLEGNEYLEAGKLEDFANRGAAALTARFGSKFTQAFQDDPKGIFSSLPRDQRLIVMRMANSSDSPRLGATGS